jgi:hypothetical protein
MFILLVIMYLSTVEKYRSFVIMDPIIEKGPNFAPIL